jgi:hypothetical protein
MNSSNLTTTLVLQQGAMTNPSPTRASVTVPIKGRASVPEELREFITNYQESRSWLVDAADAATFSINLLQSLNITDPSEVKAIHIFCLREAQTAQQETIVSRIKIDLQSSSNIVSLGHVSQFTFVNSDECELTEIILSNPQANADEKITLFTWIALNQ